MKKIFLSAALLLTLTPSLALAFSHDVKAHEHPLLHHDRAPRPHGDHPRTHQPA